MPQIIGDYERMTVTAEQAQAIERAGLACTNKWQRPYREFFYLCLTTHDPVACAEQEKDLWKRIETLLGEQQDGQQKLELSQDNHHE